MNTIPLRPILAAGLAALLLAACGAPPPPAAAPEPEPELEAEPEPEAPSRPEIPLEERIRAPFAVIAEGRTAPREPRGATVVSDRAGGAEPAAPRGAPAEGADVEEDGVAGGPAADEPAGDDEPGGAAAIDREEAAGPAAGAPPTPRAPAAAAGGAGAPREHVVEVGDTFYGIARRYGVTPAALAAVNPGVDTERLRAGQELRLPAYATRSAAERADAAPRPPTAAPEGRTHRVAAGETLWGIARRYGVPMERIREANRMADDTVRTGQTLVIPD